MKIVLVVPLIGLLVCSPLHAGGFIVGGSYGIATGGEDAASFNNELRDQGLDIPEGEGATTSGDIRTAWQAYVTYQFFSSWGVELAYVDLGEATVDFGGIDEPIDAIFDVIGDIHPRSAQGVKLSATYRVELNKNLQLQSKLGVFSWETEYFFSGVTPPPANKLLTRAINLSGTDVSLGLGLVHKLTNNVAAHLDWDFYSIDGEVVNLFTFGASYKFE
ncbi:MAG: hypothetical protein DRR06_13760 [Gammaproteobacteria bacterium]|nr:MAG: hypothetical protein DRR06_13760 [Gammaproteobacteria bacterium]